MLIKSMDNREREVAELGRIAASLTGSEAQRATTELRRRQAGLKGEREAAYQIDFHFRPSQNHAVIHDLRVECNGRTAQIDHLILTRSMECYVLESKHFHAGIKITEEGEFLRWDDFRRTYVGMESPLLQNERHIAVLRDVVCTLDLPVRFGVRIVPTFRSFILVSSASRIDRPRRFDTCRVIKVDQIRKRFNQDLDQESTLSTLFSVVRLVSRETVRNVAEQLVSLHRPVQWPVPEWLQSKTSPACVRVNHALLADERASDQRRRPGPLCKNCGGARGTILHGRFGYYFKCKGCGNNTSIRFDCQPGHKPRLHKSGNEFFRECPECGTSDRYFVNDSNGEQPGRMADTGDRAVLHREALGRHGTRSRGEAPRSALSAQRPRHSGA